MVLYIIRHGNPDYVNDTLTEFGKKEAEVLGERMAKEAPDLIFMSPKGRAIATAEPTCRRMGKDGVIEPWMTERNEYMYPVEDALRASAGYRYSFGEGVTDVRDYSADQERQVCLKELVRSSDAFLEKLGYRREGGLYRITEPNDRKVACYCHGGFGGAWIAHLLDMMPGTGFLRLGMNTASITKIEFSEESIPGYAVPKMTSFNDISHLEAAGLAGDALAYGN